MVFRIWSGKIKKTSGGTGLEVKQVLYLSPYIILSQLLYQSRQTLGSLRTHTFDLTLSLVPNIKPRTQLVPNNEYCIRKINDKTRNKLF